MKLDEIQPSQLYISRLKLNQVLRCHDQQRSWVIEPIPVKKLGDQVVFVDGHTRALAAFLRGVSEVSVYWYDEGLSWELYKVCVEWCKKDGIQTIADLEDRVISHRAFERMWIKRCEKTERELETRHKM
jgi:hypothetical protein